MVAVNWTAMKVSLLHIRPVVGVSLHPLAAACLSEDKSMSGL